MMMNKLPEFVEAYLEEGAPEGTRNETLFKAALQLRDMSWGESDIYACLERRGLLDGLPPSEIKASVRSALNRGRRNPPSKPTTKAKGYDGTEYRGRGGIRNYKLDNKPRGFTPGFINRGAEDVEKLDVLFDDLIALRQQIIIASSITLNNRKSKGRLVGYHNVLNLDIILCEYFYII